ncbi:hypothetical protein D9M68_1005800 [compost metagenome]
MVVTRHPGALQHLAFHVAPALAGHHLRAGRAGEGQREELALEHGADRGIVWNEHAAHRHVDCHLDVARRDGARRPRALRAEK